MHSVVGNSSTEGNQDEGEPVGYSLGKQNRWLLPELIKTNSSEFEGEVVLVERYTRESAKTFRRPDSFSVFNSKNSSSKDDTTRKPKRKLAKAKDCARDREEPEMKTRYEVTYPQRAGSSSKSIKRPAARFGKRKKNSSTRLMLGDDFDDLHSTEHSESEYEEDFSEQFDRTSNLDLGLFVDLSHQYTTEVSLNAISTSQNGKCTQHEEEDSKLAGKCIFVESDDEMHDAHLELLNQISTGCSLLDAKNQIRNNKLSKPEVQKGRKQARKRSQMRNPDHKPPEKLVSSAGTHSVPVESPQPDTEAHVIITLRRQEVAPAALEEQWGKMYKEGASYPRTFLLNIAPLLPISNSQEVFIVFRVCEDHASSREVKALVAFVICSGNCDNVEKTQRDFISQISIKSANQDIRSLEDIANVAALCFHQAVAKSTNSRVDWREPRQPRLSMDVFTNLFGWKSKTYSSQGAKQEIKAFVTVVEAAAAAVVSDSDVQHQECGICFKDMRDKDAGDSSCFISLNACGHKFCDNCWRAHLKTQIQLGHTDLRCPGHECTAAVDDVMLMSLLPSLYGRHLTKRLNTFLEMNPEWKWCPTDQCKLVVKATTPQDPSLVSHAGIVQPFPVVCVCGTMWCFKCQEDAHWPATCEEAKIFREKNASYARLVTNTTKKNKLITSVQVKHCPFCHYPVEKGMGCDHMTCILCWKEFCWLCLGKWSYPHHCHNHVNLRKVKLPTNLVNILSYEHVAVTSRVARTSFLICRIHRKLDKVEKELNIYAKCSILKPELKEASHTEKRVNLLRKINAPQHLKKVFNFKFQALLVLEGAAIRLAFLRNTSCSKRLAVEFNRLLFIVERMDQVLKDFSHCLKDKDSLYKLKYFVKCGKRCILSIGGSTDKMTVTS